MLLLHCHACVQLGMALNVYNDLTVRTDVTEFAMTIEGEGAGACLGKNKS